MSCTPLIDWDWSDDSNPDINYVTPEALEISIIVDSITSITNTTAVAYFTLYAQDNPRIDRIYISTSTMDNGNPDNYILYDRYEYVNFEVTECFVPSSINPTNYPIFMERDMPIKCCAELDNLKPNTEYFLVISPQSEWPIECIDCVRYPFTTLN